MTPRETRRELEGLYRSHRKEVYRVALRKIGDHHEAEDVTQTAFLDAYRALLRGSRPELPRPWLLAIAENVRRRRFRTALRRPRQEPLREALPSAEPPWRAQTEEIRAALATLADNQRKAFLLRELGGFSYAEIASFLDTSVPAVQMLLFRARQKLRAELEPTGAIRIGGLIPIPHWLIGVADRVSFGAATPRVAGIVAAGVVVAGVGVTSSGSIADPGQRPPASTERALKATVRAPAARPTPRATMEATRLVARPAAPRSTAKSAKARPARRPAATVSDGGAETAAPVAPPATLGMDDRAPAPALVLALPPVSQAPTVPVVKAPLPQLPVVKVPLPPLPEPPVEDIPTPPDVPVVPPPVPAPPGDAEVTLPEVPIPLPGP